MVRLYLLVLLAISCGALPVLAQQEYPLASAAECTARQGLPNFLAKARRKGAELKVGYLGGSITAQQGWRVFSLELLQKRFPLAHFSEINAAIGGTGSDLGVFRLKQDVLDKQPDLLFVEFAVNDGGAPPEQITRCMEGIVRQTWHLLPKCDICFVYTVTESLAGPMLEGKFPRAASVMEQVANRYGIPTIHMAMEVAALARAGKLVWSAPLPKTDAERAVLGDKLVFAADSVHPYPETGHKLYVAAIERSLVPIEAASHRAGPHRLPAPIALDNYEGAKLIPLEAGMLSAGFQKLDPATNGVAKIFATYTGGLYRSNKPGETINFKFKGTYASIYDIIGPDCGQVIVTLDGKAPKVVPRFDGFCTYHRLATLVIGADLPNTIHTVHIEIQSDQVDKVAVLARNGAKMDNPARFNDTAFYPGAILVNGDIVR